MSREWSNGLFGCFKDVTTCIISFIVPCYTLGKNAEAVSENCLLCGLSYFVIPLGWYAHVTIRGKIREQKGIEGTCLKDLLFVIFCYGCALTQEAQEVNSPGAESMARE